MVEINIPKIVWSSAMRRTAIKLHVYTSVSWSSTKTKREAYIAMKTTRRRYPVNMVSSLYAVTVCVFEGLGPGVTASVGGSAKVSADMRVWYLSVDKRVWW